MARLIRLHGEVVALAMVERVVLARAIERLPAGHPRLCLVALMCLYSHDVDAGELPGPYTDADALRFAASVLGCEARSRGRRAPRHTQRSP